MSQYMLPGNPLTKSNRSLKEAIDKSKSSAVGASITNSTDSADVKLPRIKSQKTDNFFSDVRDNYSFDKTSLPSFSKERYDGLDSNGKALINELVGYVRELVGKLEEQQKYLVKKSHQLHATQRNFENLSQQYKSDQAEYNDSKKIISALKDDNIELSSKVRTAQLRINDLLERIKTLERDSERVREAESKFSKLKEEHLLLYDRHKELEKVLERRRLEIADQDSRYKDLFSKHEHYKSAQNSHDEELQTLQEEIVKLKEKCESLKQQKHKTHQKTSEEKINTEDYENKIKELTSKMGKFQTQYIDIKENSMIQLDKFDTLKKENIELKEKLGEFGSSQEVTAAQLKLFHERIEELEFEKTEVDSQLVMKNELIQKYLRDIDELREQLQNELARFAKYKDVIMMYDDFRNRNKGDLVWMNQQISDKYEQEIADLREELSVRKKKIHELIDEKAKIEFERRQLQNELNGINQEISEMRERKTSLQKEIEKLNVDLQDKLKKLSKVMRDFTDESVRSKTLSDMNNELKKELEEKNIHILTLEAKLVNRSKPDRTALSTDNLNYQIRTLKGQIDEHINIIPSLSDKTKKTGDDKEPLLKENKMLKEEIAKLKKEGSGLQEKIDNLKVDLAASNKNLEDFKSAVESDKKLLEAEIARLKKEGLNRGESSMEELETARKEIRKLTEENEELRKDIANKDREYDKVQNIHNATLEEKKELEDKMNYLRDVCNHLTQDNASRAEVIETHLHEITTLNTKIASLKEDLKRFDGIDLNQINNRIKQLETREATLYSVVLKIEHAEDSLGANLSCCHCLELLQDSVTCVPCGHSYCSKCKQGYEGNCKECERNNTPISSQFFKNKQLDAIATKISYNRLIFESVKEKPSSKTAL